jgi:hypothetical protein
MAIKHVHFDSVIRGVLEARTESLRGLHVAATEKLAALGVKPNASAAVRTTAVRGGRGPDKNVPKGSSNFNGMSVIGWVESISEPGHPGDGATPEQLAAYNADLATFKEAVNRLVILQATLTSELA